jgi:hypothetical protein
MMARGYRLMGRNKLIPWSPQEGRHRSFEKVDQDDPFENGGLTMIYEPFVAQECVVQPMRGKAARDQNNQLVQEGEKDYDSYTVYTSTWLKRADEATNKLADQLLLKNSRGEMVWFTVMKVDVFVTSGVSRFRCYLIAVPEGTDGGL